MRIPFKQYPELLEVDQFYIKLKYGSTVDVSSLKVDSEDKQYLDFQKLNAEQWCALLRHREEFAPYFDNWEELPRMDFVFLMVDKPQFYDKFLNVRPTISSLDLWNFFERNSSEVYFRYLIESIQVHY